MSSKYKDVETVISKGSYILRQIWRKNNYAIYSQERKDSGRICAYEAIRIRTHEGFEMGERVIEPSELYPSSEKFGLDGFCCPNERCAHEKINDMKGETSNIINHILTNKEMNEQDEEKELDKAIDKMEESKLEEIKEIEEKEAAKKDDLSDNPPKKRGRRPKLLKCAKCGKEIYTSVFSKNSGLCPGCKALVQSL